ncbi:S9 family peptidase [Saccharothrix longispora]|uniref:S9 family peptidase n=1 Tax=Saccharothrix longispora TaxID=33920 RepID=UPI0028FD4FFA|nr:S9 family peptidase [Saccharothrix longispora]MBY8850339.1 S9 family peptidase [Saccharothrix sp. MB29]MDU0293137.1 S9 family peptidase [Saccharothrix longispora]
MRPDDLQQLTLPGSVSVRGDLVLVNVATPDVAANTYRGGLHRVPLDGSGARRWTWAERDLAPRISPDGRWVAFLRVARRGTPPQLHVMPADGGDARALTDLPLGAGAPVWAPDSRRLAFTARVPEAGRYGTALADGDEAPTPDAEAPRHITRLDYRIDDVGFTADRHTRLFTVDALDPDASPVELTDGAFPVADPTWSADGDSVVFVADRDLGRAETMYSDLYSVPAAGGEPTLLVASRGQAACPVALPGGGVLFYGTEFPGGHSVARNLGLWRFDGEVGGEAVRLTDTETVDCEKAAGPAVVTGDGVLVAVRNRGAVELRRVPLDAAGAVLDDLEPLAGERAEVKSFAADGDVVVAVVSTPDNTGEVVRVGGEVLTALGSTVPLRPAVELTGTAPDGYPVHGWLVLPEGEGPHPVVLTVHGGPFMYHGWGFYDEAQVYAAAGYAVVLPNPRGSAGYGQAHGQAVVGAFGTVDVDDVLAVLDVALERPELDADRVGVMGGSYGGFMTSWLAAHHGERFRAAWSERAVNAWDSFAGSSDIGWFFTDAYCGPGLEKQRAMSPLTYAEKISTPFMVVHSEHDWRCPLEQAQRLYVALRRNGVEAEMLLFPGEGHELTRSGKPRHREQRFGHVLAWWGRHLR